MSDVPPGDLSPFAPFLRHELANVVVGLRWLSLCEPGDLDPQALSSLMSDACRRVDLVLAAMRLVDDPGEVVRVEAANLSPSLASALPGIVVEVPSRLPALLAALGPARAFREEGVVAVDFETGDAAEWVSLIDSVVPGRVCLAGTGTLRLTSPG